MEINSDFVYRSVVSFYTHLFSVVKSEEEYDITSFSYHVLFKKLTGNKEINKMKVKLYVVLWS